MRLRGKELASVVGQDIQDLVDNQVPESATLDYKKGLPGNSDGEKKEFLADVSSFANTQGGVIVYGIEEKKDNAGQNTGVPEGIVGLDNVNLDQTKQRLESSLRDGLDPKLANVAFAAVEAAGKTVLLAGIPRSLLAPHMVWYQRDGKFHARASSGKYQMDVRSIKQAFLQADEWERAADDFRRTRVMDLRSGKILLHATSGSWFVHVLPLGSNRTQVDLKRHAADLNRFKPPLRTSWNSRFNLDGYLVYDRDDVNPSSYVQFFRTGGIEVYTCLLHGRRAEGRLDVFGESCETQTIKYVMEYLKMARKLEVEPPFAVYLTCTDVAGRCITKPDGTPFTADTNKFDREDILLPAVLIEDTCADVPGLLRPVFDMLWQSAGLLGSPYYTQDGSRRAQSS